MLNLGVIRRRELPQRGLDVFGTSLGDGPTATRALSKSIGDLINHPSEGMRYCAMKHNVSAIANMITFSVLLSIPTGVTRLDKGDKPREGKNFYNNLTYKNHLHEVYRISPKMPTE